MALYRGFYRLHWLLATLYLLVAAMLGCLGIGRLRFTLFVNFLMVMLVFFGYGLLRVEITLCLLHGYLHVLAPCGGASGRGWRKNVGFVVGAFHSEAARLHELYGF